jgi:hypothetical protein
MNSQPAKLLWGFRLRRARQELEKFFYAPSRPHAIGLLRVLLGLAMLKEWVEIGPAIQDLYGRHGFLQETLMLGLGGQGASLLSSTLSDDSFASFLGAFYWARLGLIAAFTIGLLPRVSTVLLWGMQIYLMSSGEFSSYGVHRYFMVLLFLLVFMPAGESFNLLRWARKAKPAAARWEATFSLRVLQLAVLITYVDAGISKTAGEHWWNGDAVWRSLHLPEFHRADFLWMAAVPFVPKLLSWGTMFLEAFYVVGVWFPGVGPLWSLAVISMHLGIAAYLGLVNFGLTMAAINVALFLYPRYRPRSFSMAGFSQPATLRRSV